ncbi:hypothetical protein C3K47_05765 [Solitalea longa]|uniref:Phenylalanyl-tRNA synthetase subunit alpha n=1 Tax=Solitalea longa TaxID=2079460 RepID=A0A2S5A6X6_9SPHI|nr:hypothetical protein [Solitalea longa]POY38059.1 hypothetical protein C3K47_05765 [Solitalea longa]
MKKDLPENIVKDVAIVIALEKESAESREWNVYLLNLNKTSMETVLVSSRGFGTHNGKEVKTSVLRHSIGIVSGNDYAKVEAIDEQVFGLTNEYWVSFYKDGVLYDKKYVFLPESVVEDNFIKLPLIDKVGVMIQ